MRHISVTIMTCASCSVQSGVGLLQMSRASCSRQPRPHLKVPLLQLTRRTAPQQYGASLAAAVRDAASTRSSVSVPRFQRALRLQKPPAVMSASSASSSASKPTAARKQLDQFFDILSSDKQIMTAQCWSFADYETFEDRMLRRGVLAFWPFKKTSGCCYLAGQEAEHLAKHGHVELIYSSFKQHEDLADKLLADLIYNTALTCNLPIQRDDDSSPAYSQPSLKIIGFDPEEFAEESRRLESFEYNDDGTLANFLIYKRYRNPGVVQLFGDMKIKF